ncbi:MAG TPA: hypothetical protein VEI97_05055, partial [bacterium]|nr:hypothetical protein [bacterium]
LILVLATIGSVSFLETLRQGKEERAKTRLMELAALEQIYFRDFEQYATFDELQDKGLIARQYAEDDTVLHNATVNGERRTGFINDYVLNFEVSADSFRITAQPLMAPQAVRARWRLLGRNEDLRSLYVTEDGQVRYARTSRPVR